MNARYIEPTPSFTDRWLTIGRENNDYDRLKVILEIVEYATTCQDFSILFNYARIIAQDATTQAMILRQLKQVHTRHERTRTFTFSELGLLMEKTGRYLKEGISTEAQGKKKESIWSWLSSMQTEKQNDHSRANTPADKSTLKNKPKRELGTGDATPGIGRMIPTRLSR